MKSIPPIEIPLLRDLPAPARADVVGAAERRHYPAGALMLSELEPGEELLVLLCGRAAVTVGTSELSGEERLGEIGVGETVGEIALLTGALRSASVRALEPVEALAIRREQLVDLMACHPLLARYFLRELSGRLAAADRAIELALAPQVPTVPQAPAAAPLEALDGPTRQIAVRRRPLLQLLRGAFQELVLEHRRELPFYLLSSFLAAFVAARAGIYLLAKAGLSLEDLLRTAYVAGVLLLLFSSGLAPFVYRRWGRRILCVGFGAGAGLVVNELSVWLSFDVFYKDIYTRDTALQFDPAALYHRSATSWAFMVAVAFLAQVTYLSRFYRRTFRILRERVVSRLRRH